MSIYQIHYDNLYGRGGREEKIDEYDLLHDPFLSCSMNMFESCDFMEKIKETDELIRKLPSNHLIIFRGRKCIFADSTGYNILEGSTFNVGNMTESEDGKYCIFTWTMEFRKQFLVSAQILKSLPNLRSFVTDTSTRLKSINCMQYLRICAMMINCNYVIFTNDGECMFIRGLGLCDGVCCCGKVGGLRCSGCKKTYCSSACQKSDWKEHKFFCN